MYPAIASRDTIIHKNDRICQFRIVRNQPEIVFNEVKNWKVRTGKDSGVRENNKTFRFLKTGK